MSEAGMSHTEKDAAAWAAMYALRRAVDESTNGLTANSRFIDQEVRIALGELERAFPPVSTQAAAPPPEVELNDGLPLSQRSGGVSGG